jgi:hypothetical protein
LPAVQAMRTDLTRLDERVQDLRARQHGGLWTFIVGIAAFVSFITLAIVIIDRAE